MSNQVLDIFDVVAGKANSLDLLTLAFGEASDNEFNEFSWGDGCSCGNFSYHY